MTNTQNKTTLAPTHEKRLQAYFSKIRKEAPKKAKEYYKVLTGRKEGERFDVMRKNWSVSVNVRAYNKQTTKKARATYFKNCLLSHFEKKAEQTIANIQTILEADDFKSLEIRTNWVRSATWGHNPNSKGWINNSNYTEARASGCGYDKLSAVYNKYLNNNIIKKAILLEVLKHPLNTWRRGDYDKKYILPYCVYVDTYGVSVGANGAGVSTVKRILEFIGASVKVIDLDNANYLEAIKQ